MNRQVSQLSKALALLAITLLPVQQSLSAVCCCQGGLRGVNRIADGSPAGCCSQDEMNCSSGEKGPGRSCCESDSAGSKSKPCKCPGGCAKNSVPAAADPATIESSSHDDLAFAPFDSILADTIEITTNDATGYAFVAIASAATSGSERCVQLCRYRL